MSEPGTGTTGKITQAPWTPEQVASLTGFQQRGSMHPFTCGRDECRRATGSEPLTATVGGWVCPHCDYRQDWAHAWMADWSWQRSPQLAMIADLFSGVHDPVEPRPLVTVARADLETVYGYARNFDADSDPAMQRVREALGMGPL